MATLFHLNHPRPQVRLYSDGVLEVHGNVVFEANTAGDEGGAVSLPFVTILLLPVAVCRDRFCEGVGLIR